MKKAGTVLLVSEFGTEDQPYTYATSFAKSLEGLGYLVSCLDCKNGSRSDSRFWKFVNKFLANRALRKCFVSIEPDMVFLLKAETVSFRTLCWMKRKRSFYLINFYPDSPFAVWNGNSNADVLRSLPLYDRFAIWSHDLIPALESAGCRDVIYFPFAYDHSKFFFGADISHYEHSTYDCDVLFVGAWDEEREILLQALVSIMPNINLAIWGGRWMRMVSGTSPLFKYIRGGSLSTGQMVFAFHCAKIVLNLLRRQNVGSHNMRTFEVPACGAFLLAERSREQAELLFKEGLSIACFDGVEELAQKISYYLEHPTERESIAAASYRVAQKFRLDDFLAKILSVDENGEKEKSEQTSQDCNSDAAS